MATTWSQGFGRARGVRDAAADVGQRSAAPQGIHHPPSSSGREVLPPRILRLGTDQAIGKIYPRSRPGRRLHPLAGVSGQQTDWRGATAADAPMPAFLECDG